MAVIIFVLFFGIFLEYSISSTNGKYYASTIVDTQIPISPSNLDIVEGSSITKNISEYGDTIVTVTGSAITLVWEDSSDNMGIDKYEIFCDDESIGISDKLEYTYWLENKKNVSHFYVLAKDLTGNVSSESNSLYIISDFESFLNDFEVPSVPTNITNTSISDSINIIEWEASFDNLAIQGYEIYKNGEKIGFTKKTRFVDDDYKLEPLECYKIVAIDLAGNRSQDSNENSDEFITNTVDLTQKNSTLKSSGIWTRINSLYKSVTDVEAVELNGKLYVVSSTSIYEYDEIKDHWTKKIDTLHESKGHVVEVVANKLYIIDLGNYGWVEEYNPFTNSLRLMEDIPLMTYGACSAVVNDKIYVIGGRIDNQNTYRKGVQVLDPYNDKWEIITTNIDTFPNDIAAAAVIDNIIYVAGGSNNCLVLYNPLTNSWTTKASMNIARYNHGLAAVGGKLYAIGGNNTMTVEEYSPLTDTWTICADMPIKKSNFGIVTINDKIYTVDGYNSSARVDVFLPNFDTSSDVGNSIETAKLIPLETEIIGLIDNSTDKDYYTFMATETTSYDILVLGYPANTYLYNSNGEQLAYKYFTNVSPILKINLEAGQIYYIEIQALRQNVGAYGLRVIKTINIPTRIHDNFYNNTLTIEWDCVRGAQRYEIEIDNVVYDCKYLNCYEINKFNSNSAYKYRVRAVGKLGRSEWSSLTYTSDREGTWEFKSSLPEDFKSFGITSLDGKIYAIGGENTKEVYEYDILNDSWVIKTNLSDYRGDLGVASVNGKVYAIGGYADGWFSSVNEYDPIHNTWTIKASMSAAKTSFGTAVLNNKIYVVGGIGEGINYLNTLEVYDPITNLWSTLASMPTPRSDLSLVACNNKLYAIGGYDGSKSLNTVEVYDHITNLWTTVASMSTTRRDLGTVEINGEIIAIGGRSDYNDQGSVELYLPEKNIWVSLGDKLIASSCFGITQSDGKVYVIGGEKFSDEMYEDLRSVEMLKVSNEYIYDVSNRLSEIRYLGTTRVKFNYDKNGNLINKIDCLIIEKKINDIIK